MSDESEGGEHYPYYSGSGEDDDSHESESESDGAHPGFLDLEASEASSEPDHDGQSLSDGGSYDGSHAGDSFPRFMQLPPEIREMVWAAFCPDLGPEPRVLELHLHCVVAPPGAFHLPMVVRAIAAGPQLESQTEPMRAVLAVHQESRALALKSAPHELPLAHGVLVRYHEERDVLFISWNDEIRLRGIALRFQELGIEARSIAFPSVVCHHNQDELVDLMYLLPQARRLFILDEEEDLRDPGGVSPLQVQDYAWTATNKVYRYRLDAEEEGEYGLPNTVSRIFCWPDLDRFPEFAEENVTKRDDSWWWTSRITEFRNRLRAPLEDSGELNQDDISDEEKAEAIERLQNIEVWPMVRFNFGEGLELFYYMETHGLDRDRLPPDYLSDSEGSDGEIEDEYESSGIDDDPIDDSTSDEDEDELLGQHLGRDSPHMHEYSSQLLDNVSEMGDLAPANFSGDDEGVREQDHITLTSDSESDSGSRSRTLRRERLVVDSSPDESATETEETPPSGRRRHLDHLLDVEDLDTENDNESSGSEPVREASRRARALPISSEDELEEGNDDDEDDVPQPARSGRRRGRVVPADSDDDDDDDDEVVVQQPSGSRKRRGRVVQVDSDDEDEDEDEDEDGQSDSQGGGAKTKAPKSSDEEPSSSDEEDDDPPPPKRMSLAKRLSMEGRQAQSRHPRRLDDSEAEEMTGDGYGYSDDQEDEVDGSDNSMVMGMAEESEGEDGESEEDY
ncbi:hypothetical protein KVR01_012441 [Diaporthe batatas]|uniref:uncharacterized protein n=1 Tax=Diaporthe batatas TaxID=748121 RepID=UPI001D053062|nr:uncharacterized protein KVR01_012441 [Diaporthe batatas]KAG8157779.1 hypothetical protein KVR01_012441 [Diaporthe batatas]